MRRSIDSHYIRKKRYSRRAKDNWRKQKTTPHKYKYGGKKMITDKQLWIAGITMLAMWASTIAWMIWEAFK